MIEPTDAELDELRQTNGRRLNFVTLSEFGPIARAVLEKWGTPPWEGEVVACGNCGGTGWMRATLTSAPIRVFCVRRQREILRVSHPASRRRRPRAVPLTCSGRTTEWFLGHRLGGRGC